MSNADLAARFARACELTQSGRDLEARQAYLDLLAIAPDHAGALNNLGTLLFNTGFVTAARTAYAEAVARHPTDPVGRVNLGNLHLEAQDFAAARVQFEAALAVDPSLGEAHRGLAYCLEEAGDETGARRHRDFAYEGRAITRLAWRGQRNPIRVLMLAAARGGNIPARLLLDDRVFATTVAIADYCDHALPLPAHDVLFNAIGDADLAGDAIEAARRLVAAEVGPIVNHPDRIAPTGRLAIAQRLADIPNVRTPKIALLPRAAFAQPGIATILAAHGLAFPLLLRSLGFHTGRHFVRIEGEADAADAARTLPGTNLAAIEILDGRASDGKWRKYRAMMIDGLIYPLHLAVSDHWKVHYFTAGMAGDPERRAEERRYLEDMAGFLGTRAVEALDAIRERLGLDYGGIDFGVDSAGDVLLFEANATMVINPPEPDAMWDYRRRPVARALDAAREMLVRRSGVTSVPGKANLS